MELLFTWIENYRNIRRQGINFSSEFNISFDHQKNVLSIERKQNHIPNFFGNGISNVSVIVGENGTGKTSILNIREGTFYLGRKDKNYFIVCSNKELLSKISFNTIAEIKIEKYEKSNFNDTLFIQYSNYVDGLIEDSYNSLFEANNIFNFSTNRLVLGITSINNEDFNGNLYIDSTPFTRQLKSHLSEIGKQMRFLLKDDNHTKLKFNTPEILTIRFDIVNELNYLSNLYNKGGGYGDEDDYK
ncbi:hypothetical protein [Emticicia fluvialis]|uniref:hypothetical protein n=1 Tax=Emticicia fluvialis TaxID=2974474 RepID=UPI002165A45B|nr:hypothetical protein [Emticicia fluvialis]